MGRIREVDRRALTLSWITSLCSRKRFILHHNSVDMNITVISHNSSQNIRWLQQKWNMAAKKILTEDWILDFGVGVVHVEQQLLEQELQVWAARLSVIVSPQRWEPRAQRLQRFDTDVFTAVVHTLQQLWTHTDTLMKTATTSLLKYRHWIMKVCNNNYYTDRYALFKNLVFSFQQRSRQNSIKK